MRVLFQNRSDAFTKSGGDTTQMRKTAEGLQQLGVEVDVRLEPVTDYSSYDLVHLFNIQTFVDTRQQLERAKAAGKQVALSTIWWRFTEYEIHRIRRPQWNRLQRVMGTALTSLLFERWMRARRPNHDEQSWLLRNADLLLPNSAAERDILIADFKLATASTRFHVIPYGVDATLFQHSNAESFIASHGLREFVVCAARIENRKNQLHLIRAMKEIDAPLVLVGQPNPNQEDYVSLVRAAASELGPGRVHFVEHLRPEALASAYAAAKVHALVSWLESPGLASMEAAVAGCNIVTTDRAPVDEYFGDLAWRCDPSSIRSIRDAIRAALAAPRRTALRDKIISEFTWERAARETLKGYEMILRGAKKPH
jgi:glycosyltransferase involved in cell wall biosynthesis